MAVIGGAIAGIAGVIGDTAVAIAPFLAPTSFIGIACVTPCKIGAENDGLKYHLHAVEGADLYGFDSLPFED